MKLVLPLCVAGLLVFANSLDAQSTWPALSVDGTSPVAAVSGAGTPITDAVGDFATSSFNTVDYDQLDIVGDANIPALAYGFGTYGGSNAMLLQIRFNAFDTINVGTPTVGWFNTQNVYFAIDSNADGNGDLYFGLGGTAAAPTIRFFGPANKSQTSPNNISWNAAEIVGTSVSATFGQNYNYVSTTNQFGSNGNDALFRLIVTLPQLNAGLTGASATNTTIAAGSQFRVMAFSTSSTTNYRDLDMTGYGTATSTAFDLVYGTNTAAPVPEPEHYGAMLIFGGAALVALRRKLKFAS